MDKLILRGSLLQRPQLVVDDVRFVSHPLRTSPSQSPRPPEQTGTTHIPLWQALTPPGIVQRRSQAPQWFTSARVSISHPLEALPSQLSKPAMHMKPQEPFTHMGVDPGDTAHARPHAPQCITLL